MGRKDEVDYSTLEDLQGRRDKGVRGAQEDIDKYFFGPGKKAEKAAKLAR